MSQILSYWLIELDKIQIRVYGITQQSRFLEIRN